MPLHFDIPNALPDRVRTACVGFFVCFGFFLNSQLLVLY